MTWRHVKPASQRGLGAGWQALRKRILERDCYLCQCSECKASGRVRVAHEVDHIVPRFKGGKAEDANLQAINRDCHKRKTQDENGTKPKAKVGVDGWPVA